MTVICVLLYCFVASQSPSLVLAVVENFRGESHEFCVLSSRGKGEARQAKLDFEIVCWQRVRQSAANRMDLELADTATESRDQYIIYRTNIHQIIYSTFNKMIGGKLREHFINIMLYNILFVETEM